MTATFSDILTPSGNIARAYGGHFLNNWFDYQVSQVERLSTPPTTTYGDIILSNAVSATVFYDRIITITGKRGTVDPVTFSSDNPTVASVDSVGRVTHNTNGTATITITSSARTASFTINFQSGTQSTSAIVGAVAGSVRKAIYDFFDTRIAGQDPVAVKPIWSQRNFGTRTYSYNPSSYLSDLDLSGISVGNSITFTPTFSVLYAITPRHVVMPEHYFGNAPFQIRFLPKVGDVVERTVVRNNLQITPTDYMYPDFRIGLLDSDLPASIHPLKIVPSDWATYFSIHPTTSKRADKIPFILVDQDGNGLIADTFGSFNEPNGSVNGHYVLASAPSDPVRRLYYETLIAGDSGGPWMIPYNGEPYLISHSSSSSPMGSSVAAAKAPINAVLTALGGGYQLTEGSFAGANTYP